MEIEEVERRLADAGLQLRDKTRLRDDRGYQYRFQSGEVVTVYDTGTVVPQGRNQEVVRGALGLEAGGGSGPAPSRTTFVVYGHDEQAKDQLEAMLRRWGLEPLILDQLPSEGATVIEKLESYASTDVAFAVVLATPDDEGHVAGRDDEKAFRARQNVVLEIGLLLARLGRPRVAILLKNQEQMERPSDIQGLVYIPFVDHVHETAIPLAKEMQKQGIHIEVSKL